MQTVKWNIRSITRSPLPELFFWVGALVWLALTNHSGSHFTLCPLALCGIEWCPGCGLGRSISLAFHGQWMDSLHMHPLGLFAIAVISYRIYNLVKLTKTQTHGS